MRYTTGTSKRSSGCAQLRCRQELAANANVRSARCPGTRRRSCSHRVLRGGDGHRHAVPEADERMLQVFRDDALVFHDEHRFCGCGILHAASSRKRSTNAVPPFRTISTSAPSCSANVNTRSSPSVAGVPAPSPWKPGAVVGHAQLDVGPAGAPTRIARTTTVPDERSRNACFALRHAAR